MIRILLVDDQRAVRQGLRLRLTLEPDLGVVAEAGDGTEALTLARSASPHVIVMDVQLPGPDGIAVACAMRDTAPACAVIMLSIHDDSVTRDRAQAAGAVAFVSKHGSIDELVAAIRQATPRRHAPI